VSTISFDALALHDDDSVATALRPLGAGETVTVRHGQRTVEVSLLDAIPLCHKFALTSVAKGETVRKYGESIGRATREIDIGMHVHIHNLVSTRAS